MNTNNKKFRKSTIVIPALALMVLTAGASATGAVAWFTATRQVTATASTFTAASTTAALGISTTKGQGTETTSTSTNPNGVVKVQTTPTDGTASDNYLCDASFDATSGKLYHSKLNDDGKVDSFVEITNNLLTGEDYKTGKKTNDSLHDIYYAVNWQYTFHYETTNPSGSALLFDLSSSFGSTASSGVSAGFRIAFVNTTDTTNKPYRVWTNDDVKTYVNSTTATYGGDSTSLTYSASYAAPYIIKTNSTYTRISDSSYATSGTTNVVTSLAEYLGTFTPNSAASGSDSNAVKDITLKCTAWYEGSDPAVVNDQLDSQLAITASMKFYVRDLK